VFNIVFQYISLFASAGGGGSGSGGGGGGGDILVALFGYAPSHVIGAALRKKFLKNPDLSGIFQILGWIIATIIALIWIVIGAIISSGDDDYGIGFFLIIAGALSWPGMGAGLYGWFSKIKRNKAAQAALQTAAQTDPIWNETFLKNGAQNIFVSFQRDWSNFNTQAMKAYLTPHYYAHVELMMLALKQMNRQNITTVSGFNDVQITAAYDAADNSQDSFVAGIDASADDELVDTATNEMLFTNKNPIQEFWWFLRDGNSWRLNGIQPATAAQWTANPPMEQFAATHGAFYSLDWGWLLLPRRGQLFANGKFGTSDINNHVIGQLARTDHIQPDDIIYQLYTYSEQPAVQNTKIYLIGQITVPKNYGNIILRRRKGLFQFKIRGLKEVSTEWGDFNKKFQIFATSPEQATSFELLNPKFMEQLEAAPFEINLEVVDNTIYFYAPLKKIDVTHYETILQILQTAYREMRM
jgi:hypothetical protein